MKQVGAVSAKQFGYVYIDGIPFSPKKVKRFMSKGIGIKVQDIVIFDFELIDGERVLNYIKNAIYAEEDESKMVKEFIRATELKKIDTTFSDGLSDGIKKDLAEEGLVITNEGVFQAPAPDDPCGDQKCNECPVGCDGMLADDDLPFYAKELNPELLLLLTPDERKTLSIYLQSSLKIAVDIIYPETVAQYAQLKGIAIDLTEWIDKNSTQILPRAEAYLKAGSKK